MVMCLQVRGERIRYDWGLNQQESSFSAERPVGIVLGNGRGQAVDTIDPLDFAVPSAPKWLCGLCRGNPARGSIFFRDKRHWPLLPTSEISVGCLAERLFILNRRLHFGSFAFRMCPVCSVKQMRLLDSRGRAFNKCEGIKLRRTSRVIKLQWVWNDSHCSVKILHCVIWEGIWRGRLESFKIHNIHYWIQREMVVNNKLMTKLRLVIKTNSLIPIDVFYV